jgi:hypothetical protein
MMGYHAYTYLCICGYYYMYRVDDFTSFPTFESLRDANHKCGEGVLTYDVDGVIEPSPLRHTKDQVFVLADFKTLDERACQV